jgi:dihydrofolate reductase
VAHTAGADGLSVIEFQAPFGDSPPLHVHHVEDELFHILEGEFRFAIGGEEMRAGPGEMILAPKGVPHTFRVESADGGRYLIMTTHGDFERFVRELSRPAERAELPAPSGPPTPEQIQALGAAAMRNNWRSTGGTPMGNVVVTENATLDGVIEQVDDWFSPAGGDADADNSDIVATLREQMETQGALLLGRKTFESFRGYWPAQTNDTTGITAHLNRVPKYVVSSTLEEPGWENTTILGGELTEEVRALRSRANGEIGVTGSITLVHGLIAAGLVDEYRLFVYPVVLGRGRRLFEDATNVPELKLIEAKSYRSGVVLLTYQPAERRAQ